MGSGKECFEGVFWRREAVGGAGIKVADESTRELGQQRLLISCLSSRIQTSAEHFSGKESTSSDLK